MEASVPFAGGAPRAVRVVGPDGKDVPAQIEGDTVVFLARVPPVGYAVFDVRPAETPAAAGALAVTASSIENARYRIAIDRAGDIASLFDKTLGKELLAAPARLALTTDQPVDWPAWNIDWADARKPPRAYVGGPAAVRIVERGPARVALEVSRRAEGSTFVQTIRLAAGDAGDRVEIANVIDWRTKAANLKAAFPLTASNPLATYNWDIGTIQRGNNDERKYEVPSHQWFDLTDSGGGYGVTVLSDCKNGSDKPDDRTLRLTLLRTPGIGTGNGKYYSDQATQDWGRHTFTYGLAAHAGDWRAGRTDWEALRLNQPLLAFATASHDGPLGRVFSLVSVSSPRVRMLALKKAEEGDEVVVRLVEMDGRPAGQVRVAFAEPIVAAREMDAQEQALGAATVSEGTLVANFGPYQPRTFAVTLGTPPATAVPPAFGALTLPCDRTVSTADGATTPEGFVASLDSARNVPGASLPAEMLPATISYAGIEFALSPSTGGAPDAVVPRGQTIALPDGVWDRLYVLAASADGDRPVTFRVGDRTTDVTIAGLGRVHRAVGQPHVAHERGGGAAAHAHGARIHGPRTGLHQARAGGLVRLAPSRRRRTERAVRLCVSLRLRARRAAGRPDADASVERRRAHPRRHRRAGRRRRAAGAPAVRHPGALGGFDRRIGGGPASARMPARATTAMCSAISSMWPDDRRKSGASRAVTGFGWQKRHSAWMPATTRVTRASRGGRPISSLTSVRR